MDFDVGTTGAPSTFTDADPQRIRFQLHYVSGGGTLTFQYDGATETGQDSFLLTPAVIVPENLWVFLTIIPFIPVFLRRRRRRV